MNTTKTGLTALITILTACGGGGQTTIPETPYVPPVLEGTPASSASDIFNEGAIAALESGMTDADKNNPITIKLVGENIKITGYKMNSDIPIEKFNTNGKAVFFNGEMTPLTGKDLTDVRATPGFSTATQFKEKVTLQLGGKAQGLEFSEFGRWGGESVVYNASGTTLGSILDDEARNFAVGYTTKIKTLTTENFTFTGGAYAWVNYDDDNGRKDLSGTATLEFNNGRHDLSANFANGNVKVQCDNCSNAFTFTIDNNGNTGTFNKYKYDATFYGESSATEVVGELSGEGDYGFDMSFGATKQ
jgi:hypothetical protein